MKRKSQALIFGILMTGANTFAQQSTSSLSMDAVSEGKKPGTFHVTVDLSKSSNLYKEDSPDHEGSTDLELNPSVDLTKTMSLSTDTIISQQQVSTGTRDTTVSNTKLALKFQGPQLSSDLSSSFKVTGLLPTDREGYKTDHLQGGAGLGGSLTYEKWIAKLKYSVVGSRNFHEFTVNADGNPNVQYTLTQELLLDLQLTKQLVFETSGYYKQGWTYHNFGRQTYGYSASLGYDVTKAWSIGLAVETEGKAFKPNGTDSNMKFYDVNNSVVKANVTFTN